MPPEEEFTTGQASQEEAMGYQALPEAPEPEETTYNSDAGEGGGIRQAAKELEDSRQREAREPVDRSYRERAGTGELVEDNQTVKLDRAADDLARVREIENAEVQDRAARELATETDRIRLQAMGIDPDAVAAAQAQQANPQAQPAEQPIEPTTPGIDPEVARALQNPKVAEALRAEVASVEAARQQYAQATHTAFQTAGAAFLANYPELQGLNAQQMAGAVAVMGRTDPQRAQTIMNHAMQVNAIFQQADAARTQQAQLEQQQVSRWIESEDKKWEVWAAKPENADRVRAVQPEAVKLFESEYGVTKSELQNLYANVPAFRSNVAQQIITDALAFRAAKRSAATNPVRSVPPVMRPGVSRPPMSGDDSHLRGLEERFSKSGDPRDGARLLMARRAAR